MKKVCVIHWYIKNRDSFALSNMEKYHLNHIEKYKFQELFDEIIFCLCLNDVNDEKLISYIKCETESYCKGNITYVICKNKKSGEFETYRNYVLTRLDNDEFVYYMHFKGVSKESTKLDWETKWCDMLYEGIFEHDNMLFNEEYPLCGSRIITNGVYWCNDIRKWFLKNLWLNKHTTFIEKYCFLKMYFDNKFNMFGFLDGTFQCINTRLMRNLINDYGIDIDDLIQLPFDKMRTTHVSEYLLCSFCKDGDIKYTYKNEGLGC